MRGWLGWHHHVTLALLAGLFLLTLEQEWGGEMPDVTRPQISRVLRELLPRRIWTPDDLLARLADTQHRNLAATRSHAKRRLARLRELSL